MPVVAPGRNGKLHLDRKDMASVGSRSERYPASLPPPSSQETREAFSGSATHYHYLRVLEVLRMKAQAVQWELLLE